MLNEPLRKTIRFLTFVEITFSILEFLIFDSVKSNWNRFIPILYCELFGFDLNKIQFQLLSKKIRKKRKQNLFREFLLSEPLDMTLSGLQMCGIKNWFASLFYSWQYTTFNFKIEIKKKWEKNVEKQRQTLEASSLCRVTGYDEIWHLRTAHAITYSMLLFLFTGNRSRVVEDCVWIHCFLSNVPRARASDCVRIPWIL